MDNELYKPRNSPPLVVGLGFSAGGLEAIGEFLEALPAQRELAFVVVPHLDPGSRNLLPGLLSRRTVFAVTEATDGARLAAGEIHIAPPGATLVLARNRLNVVAAASDGERLTLIDASFRSLAQDQGERSVGVILSGAGSDGTLGLKAISEAGGMTLAQDPASSGFDSMPSSAIAAGVVDHVLAPKAMPAMLLEYARQLEELAASAQGEQAIAEALPRIAEILQQATGHNFLHYKTSTLIRRIRRRMRVTQAASAVEYVKLLAADQPEAHNLFRDLLIGVTAFFRDAEAFEELARETLPRLLRNRGANDPVRLWVPGCATGEEAYSLAIIAREHLAESGSSVPVQVFASDIDADALAQARAGRYPQGIAESVPPERLQRFFTKRGKSFHVVKEVRELCVFSLHNLISDPPFSKLDLISCRNLLIYLGPHLQKKLIPVFHYALKPGGYLFLGPSESIERENELFREVDRKHRIWQRRESATTPPNYSLEPAGGGRAAPEPPALNERDLGAIAHRIVLEEFEPCYAIVNEEGQVLYLSGGTGKFLEQPLGPFQNNIVRMARQGLRAGLRAALAAAAKIRRKVVNDQASILVDGARQRVALTVQPMPKLGEDSELLMVVFQELGAPLARSAAESGLPSAASEALIEQLELELTSTRERLESMVQDLEASREELKASNEELLSMNEELQSANEELQSSKEEVRAGNEALSQAHSDLQNLLESTQIGTLFLDGENTLRGFTPAITRIYNVAPSDIGRPLSHFTHRAKRMPPLPDVRTITHGALPVEDEIETEDGVFYMRRVLPYMREGKPTAGIVITFTEYTALKRASQRIAAVHTMTRTLAQIGSEQAAFPAILDAIRVTFSAEVALLWLPDESGTALVCAEVNAGVPSPGLQAFIEVKKALSFPRGRTLLVSKVWDTWAPQFLGSIADATEFPRKDAALAAGLTSGIAFPITAGNQFFGVIEFFTARALERDRSLLDAVAAMGHDVGQFLQRVRAEAALREASLRLELAVRAGRIYTGLWDIARDQVIAEPPLLDLFGLALGASPGLEALLRAVDAEDHERVSDAIHAALQSEADYEDEFRVRRRDNSVRWVIARGRVERDASGKPMRLPVALVDITEHKLAEQALAEREERYRLAARATNDAIWDWDLIADRIEWNQGIVALFGYTKALAGTSADWWKERIHPRDRERVRRGIYAAIEGAPEHWADEYQFRRADGSYADVLDRGYVVRHPQHGAVRMIGAMLDITGRKRLEQALRENARRHQMAVSIAGLGDWQLNLVAGILSSSAQHREHFGRAADADLSYGDFWEAVYPEDRPRLRETMNRAVVEHQQWQAEFRCVWPDGSVHWMVAVGRPEYTIRGEPTRMVGITRDVTQRKTVEETLARYYAELETKVAERTLQLSASLAALQAESAARFLLQQELQNAEESERRRIGHELHDDLGQRMVSVSFMASLLERKLRAQGMPEAEEAARLAQETRLGIARIRQLAQGMAPPELAAQDLAAALEQLTLNIGKATGIECVLEADECLNLSDQNVMLQLYRIVQEAINNAVKHGNPSRVQVGCRMQNGALSIAVEDNGVGLPPDYATKGLGVRTMQHRATTIGATLELSPAAGGGTVLTCTLPASGARLAS